MDTCATTSRRGTEEVVRAFLDDLTSTSGFYLAVRNYAAPDVTWSFPKTTNENALHGRREVESWFEIRGKETEGKPDSRFRARPKITVERVIVEGN